MNSKLAIFLFVLMTLPAYAQHKETIQQNRAGLLGVKTKADFLTAPYASWFNDSYKSYKPDQKTLQGLKAHSRGVKVRVFMSVWCHDSKREVPRLYNILEALDFEETQLKIVALDRSKKTPGNLQEGYQIIRTPTFIFYREGKEIGRYVEHPRKSLEKDMLKIWSGKNYKHSYHKK